MSVVIFNIGLQLIGQTAQLSLNELFEHENIILNWNVVQAVNITPKMPE
jgi:hypothetical protein